MNYAIETRLKIKSFSKVSNLFYKIEKKELIPKMYDVT